MVHSDDIFDDIIRISLKVPSIKTGKNRLSEDHIRFLSMLFVNLQIKSIV